MARLIILQRKDFDPEIENLLTKARNHVGEFVGGDPHNDTVIFTSGATESINLLLKGFFFANFQQKRKIITSPIEHKAVLETCKYLESIGAELEFVNITEDGVVDYDHLEFIVDKDTLFVCLMHVNNETGEISDLQRIYDIVKSANTKFFTDTTQSITKLDVNAKYFDACVGSAHKFHGPKGVGFIYFKDDINLTPNLHGGKQEFGLRAGTHNLPSIVSMVSVLQIRQRDYDSIAQNLLSQIDSITNFSKLRMSLHILLIELNPNDEKRFSEKFIYSKGSACHGGVIAQSHVYHEIYPEKNVLRISF